MFTVPLKQVSTNIILSLLLENIYMLLFCSNRLNNRAPALLISVGRKLFRPGIQVVIKLKLTVCPEM
jgi:hypothetical protein